jgi:Lrp/AsnC family transcriptional regulator, leucine-responsive regulatory protein
MDDMDRKLLGVLQGDGRITNAALAQRVNLSPTACFERVRRLQRDGYIQGYSAILDPTRLERALLIFIEITLDRTSDDVFDAFAAAVRSTPDILECHMVAGGFDYLMKARVRDMTAYRVFLGETLLKLPGVRTTHTYAVMEEVKQTTALPL